MALTAARDTQERPGDILNLPMAAATTMYLGGLGATDAAGRAVPASDAAGLKVVGRTEQTINNAGAAGALSINLKRGVFLLANSAAQPVTAAMVGKVAYVEDDQTVCATAGSTHKVVAGRVVEVDSRGVWVDTRFAPAISALVAATSTDGTAAAAADLAALKAETEKIGDDVRAVIALLAG